MKFSIVIISRMNEREKVDACIESIKAAAQGIYNVEVIVVMDEEGNGRLGHLRNTGIDKATGEIIITLDNDMLVQPDFFHGIIEVSHWVKWDVLSCRILNPDWTRFWDWKAKIPDGNYLNHYSVSDENVSLTGGLVIAKREVYDAIRWDEERKFYEEEDVEFSERLRKQFAIEFNPYSTVIHNDPTYHRIFGTPGVVRYDS